MLSQGDVMLHDNARPHTATVTQDLTAAFGWEQFDHVFLHLKSFLGGRWFHNDEIKEAINTWSASQMASFYDVRIQKLVPRYDKCLNNV
jgi:hypothetical protein